MSRLAGLFTTLADQQRKALVPYIVAGDPNLDSTLPLMHAMVEQGADIIELGVPFSDPMAEGPVIQLAHERALEHNTRLRDVLAIVAEFRQSDSDTPVVLMGYANPVERMGYEAFAKAASEAGVDGLLTVDMPPEEAGALNEALQAVGIDNVFLLAPTTTDERIQKIVAHASGYLYCVSLKGVTGAGHLDVDAVREKMAQIRQHTDLPITIGFGIKDVASAAALAPLADGIVVGSALVDRIANVDSADINAQRDAVKMLGELRQAID